MWRTVLKCLFITYWLVLQLWGVVAISIVYQVYKRRQVVWENASSEQRKYWSSFNRQDNFFYKKWHILEVFFGCTILFPIRGFILLITAFVQLVLIMILSPLCTLELTERNYLDEMSRTSNTTSVVRPTSSGSQSSWVELSARKRWFRSKMRIIVKCCSAVELATFGIGFINEYQVKNCNYDFPIDKSTEQILVDRIVRQPDSDPATQCPTSYVSNHVSFADIILYLYLLFPSFIAKAAIYRVPLVGDCARAVNCVFVQRSSVTDRERVMNVIGQRQREIWRNDLSVNSLSPQTISFVNKVTTHISPSFMLSQPTFDHDTPNLLIFPEGTTSSGRQIMPLKRGAFAGEAPLTPLVIVYRCPTIQIAYDVISVGWLFPVLAMSWHPITIELYWLREVLPVSPVEVPEKAIRIQKYADKVRGQMARVLTFAHRLTPEEVNGAPESWPGTMRDKGTLIAKLYDQHFIKKRSYEEKEARAVQRSKDGVAATGASLKRPSGPGEGESRTEESAQIGVKAPEESAKSLDSVEPQTLKQRGEPMEGVSQHQTPVHELGPKDAGNKGKNSELFDAADTVHYNTNEARTNAPLRRHEEQPERTNSPIT